MRTFVTIELDLVQLATEIDELENFLASSSTHKERDQIAPFFKARRQLCAGLGLLSGDVALTDRVANELDLFGDFVCDAAAGDSELNAFVLIEFEDAQQNSVFANLEEGKAMKRWSSRFERGFSQLVDWAWRLATEGGSEALRRIFGANDPSVHLMLIVGRNHTLNDDDKARLRWRAKNATFGPYKMTCLTFDDVVAGLRRRLILANQRDA
jgi:hypothetical protein